MKAISTALALILLPLTFPWASAQESVFQLIRMPGSKIEPAVLFSTSPATNLGAGNPEWVAASGQRMSRTGPNPWGDSSGAFGLPTEAIGGCAISGATQSALLAGESGSVLLFFRADTTDAANSILFARGTWGDSTTFEFRLSRAGTELGMFSAKAKEKPTRTVLFSTLPENWYFLVVRWTTDAGEIHLTTSLGLVKPGSSLENKDAFPGSVGAVGLPICLGGRLSVQGSDATRNLPFAGLLSHFAIYEKSLSQDDVESIYRAAIAAAK